MVGAAVGGLVEPGAVVGTCPDIYLLTDMIVINKLYKHLFNKNKKKKLTELTNSRVGGTIPVGDD